MGGWSLRYNGLVDLTPLAGLTSLEELVLDGNAVADLTPLGELRALSAVWFAHNDITDVSPLSGLSALSRVGLAYNRIETISALVDNNGLAEGDVVDLRSNPLDDVAMTSQVPALETGESRSGSPMFSWTFRMRRCVRRSSLLSTRNRAA